MKILIIIPAYNETQTLEKVIEHLKEICPQYDYVIVNDGSIDNTEELCRKNGYHVIHHPVNYGLTRAIQTGMNYALEHDYDAALQFDADGQHLPEYIGDMVTCMENTNCDIVIASRFYKTRMPVRMRTLGGKMITTAIRMTTGKHISDPTSGMRLYNRTMIRRFAQDEEYTPEPDTIAYLIRMGADVREVKAKMEDRKAGQSYLTPINATKYMLKMLSAILIFQWFRRENKITKDSGKLENIENIENMENVGNIEIVKQCEINRTA